VTAPTIEVPELHRVDGGAHVMGGVNVPVNERISLVDAAAASDARGLSVFIANANLNESVDLEIEGLAPAVRGTARWLDSKSPFDRNDFEIPDRIGFASRGVRVDQRGHLRFQLPPATVAVVALEA
jgi:alpha-L-arabinofuranosidase